MFVSVYVRRNRFLRKSFNSFARQELYAGVECCFRRVAEDPAADEFPQKTN